MNEQVFLLWLKKSEDIFRPKSSLINKVTVFDKLGLLNNYSQSWTDVLVF